MENFSVIDRIYYYPEKQEIYSEVLEGKVNHLNIAIILDYNIHEVLEDKIFSYREYTNYQNHLMKKYDVVYRFINEDYQNNIKMIKEILNDRFEIPVEAISNVSRRTDEASFLEHFFETTFLEAYGEEAFKYLMKESKIIGFLGENIFADYVLEKKNEKIIIEENGESYHHPQRTGVERYKKQIWRQNALVYQGFKVYRFSTSEILFKDRAIEEMKYFFGEKETFLTKHLITKKRKFLLYDHQSLTLENLKEMRGKGEETSLIVLPTGAGKSTIAIGDLKDYLNKNKSKKVLVIVPSNPLKNQWLENLKEVFDLDEVDDLSKSKEKRILVSTYSGIIRKKNDFIPNEFGYILIDEAHHSVADGISSVIKYFNPDFLLGMTATSERLDRKKLEDIFSQVETELSLKEAIKKGICCDVRVFRIESNIDLSEVRFNGKNYVSGDLEKKVVVNSRNELIAEVVNKYFGNTTGTLGNKQGIIFCVNTVHAEKMSRLLNERGISSKAVSGKDKKSKDYIKQYLNGEIRFLCSCQLISEGWDAPKTSIIVMARPTMSKVVYLQQLGRGTRVSEGKESLYVIDVVDNYSFNRVPWSVNSIFENPFYSPFGDVFTGELSSSNETIYIENLLERENKIVELNIETYESKYGNLVGSEELARELFVSTDTINNWVKKKEIDADQIVELGRRKIYFFSPNRIEEIRRLKGLKKRTKETILDDFWEFIEEGDYSLSYKLIFMLSLLKNIDRDGEATFESIRKSYTSYYNTRLDLGLPVDRRTCPFTKRYLDDKKLMTRNILINPFEKFERKRFLYHCKELKNIGFSFYLWKKITKEDILKLKAKLFEDVKDYYRELGGEGDISLFD